MRYGGVVCVGALCALLPFATLAQAVLRIPQPIWDSLSPDQRTQLGKRFIVSLLAPGTYGTIIDAQSLNESTAGSNVGSELGSRYASAGYVDNAVKGRPQNWNYSATGHLNAQIAGALVGSLLNTPGQARFRTRYTIRNGNGGVEYVEEIKPDAFRHTVGLCVSMDPIRPVESDLCTLTWEQFVARHLPHSPPADSPVVTGAAKSLPPAAASIAPAVPVPAVPSGIPSAQARCKFGLSSPIRLDSTACESAGGTVMPAE